MENCGAKGKNGLVKLLKEGREDSEISKLFNRTEGSIFKKKRQIARALFKKGESLDYLVGTYRLLYSDISPSNIDILEKHKNETDSLSKLTKDCEGLSLGLNLSGVDAGRAKRRELGQVFPPPRTFAPIASTKIQRYVAIHYKLQGLKFSEHIIKVVTFDNEELANAYKMVQNNENVLVMKCDD